MVRRPPIPQRRRDQRAGNGSRIRCQADRCHSIGAQWQVRAMLLGTAYRHKDYIILRQVIAYFLPRKLLEPIAQVSSSQTVAPFPESLVFNAFAGRNALLIMVLDLQHLADHVGAPDQLRVRTAPCKNHIGCGVAHIK